MCRKKAFLFATFLCALSEVWAESPCFIEGISVSDRIYTNPEEIKDSYIGTVQVFNDTNVLDAYVQNSKYIGVSAQNDTLEIFTTPEFESYEENEEESTITVSIALICTGGNDTLEYRLLVRDENNHDPQFEHDHYYYTFYESLPYLLDFALTDLQPIVARDVDLSYYELDFAIEENYYFGINYATRSLKSSKDHLAILFNIDEIYAPFNKTYEITVTDFGNRSSTALVTVEVIELEKAIFTKTLYVARLTEDLKVEVDNGPIAFVDNVENVTVTLPSEFTGYFYVEVNEDKEVELTATTPDVLNLASENDAIVLTLRSTSSSITDETLIVIYTSANEEFSDENVVESTSDVSENNEETYTTTESVNQNTSTISSNEDINNEDISTTIKVENSEDGNFTAEIIDTTTEGFNITEDDNVNTDETTEEGSSSTPMSDVVSTDKTNEETTNFEQTVTNDRPSTQTVFVELSGFKQWVSFSQGFTMFVFALAGITIAGAILCIKFNLYR